MSLALDEELTLLSLLLKYGKKNLELLSYESATAGALMNSSPTLKQVQADDAQV